MKHLLRRETGSTLVEFALILPVFLLLVLGMADLGQGFNTYLGLLNASREGAIWLAKNGDDVAGMNARIASELARVDLTAADVVVLRTPVKTTYASGDLATVTIEYAYPMMFGAITRLPTFTLHTEHTVRVQ